MYNLGVIYIRMPVFKAGNARAENPSEWRVCGCRR